VLTRVASRRGPGRNTLLHASPAAIKSMLQLNAKEPETVDGPSQAQEPVWKVLVYDQIGQDIISPLLKINNLREQGVTVHMSVTGRSESLLYRWLILSVVGRDLGLSCRTDNQSPTFRRSISWSPTTRT